MDYETERRSMVSEQLISRGIRDERVLDAMAKVERHLFVEESLQNRAYKDCALPIGDGQTISQPYMVALMTELLALKGNEKVLEIGTGSGYQAAILSILAAEVYTVERIASVASRAQDVLQRLDVKNVSVIVGDGSIGLPAKSPFDGIIVTAGAPEVPRSLMQQLHVNGRLVIPAGSRDSQILYCVRRTETGFDKSVSTGCIFVPLLGAEGWEPE